MMGKSFSVHKYIVHNSRIGLRLWASQNNKIDIYESIEKTWFNLENCMNDRVCLKLITQEYKEISSLFDEVNLGLKVIQSSYLEHSPFYKILMLSLEPILSINIEIPKVLVLRLVSHYFSIMTEVVTINYLELKHSILISFNPNLPEDISYHQIEGAMFGFTRLIARLTGTWPNEVRFTHIPSKINNQLYQETFNCFPIFKQQDNQLCYGFSYSHLSGDHYPILINPIIYALKKQFPDMALAQIIHILLQATLGFISPSRQNIANALSMSVRTLQRRLYEEGYTFNGILLAIRKKLVVEYLSYRQFTVEQISLLLGYKAKSQFLKAFRIWFGMSPKAYRAKQKIAL